VHLAPQQIERSGDESKHARENERSAHRVGCRKSNEQQQRWNSKTSAADAGQPHNQSDNETEE
jgi:hypothetical protein